MARSFVNSSSQYMDKTSVTTGLPSGYPFTLLMRAKKDNFTSGNSNIFTLNDASASARVISCQLLGDDGTGLIARTAIADTGTGIAAGVTNLSTNTWYSIAGIHRSSTDREIYVNGVSDGANSTPVTFNFGLLDQITIGRAGGSTPSNHFDGDIYDVGLYDVELTTTELLTHAVGVPCSRIRTKSLIGHWPLEGIASPEADLSGSSNNLTLTNGPTASQNGAVLRYVAMPPTPSYVENLPLNACLNDYLIPV